MTGPRIIPYAAEAALDWIGLTRALEKGHAAGAAKITDSFLYRGEDTLLNRAAWIDGLGLAVKTATIFPQNAQENKPTVNGGLCLYSDDDGTLEALVDFHLVTKWKTAGDSLLAALRLARPESENILILGAGTQAHALREAYGAGFPNARFTIWNRTYAKAEAFAAKFPDTRAVADLEPAVRAADIVTSATMAADPVLRGDWLRAGQHIDLIGAFRPDMREADDAAVKRARIFVDFYGSVIDHIGELKIPLDNRVIARKDIVADFYSLGDFTRLDQSEITLFKNGGGAHLDLMVARYIANCWKG
ncbi:ornithine cyclodeaminase [Litorivita pollutaquae]|uniref:Ornithine cyclodeaminase n=1 Tax=Litorivita pollutaquae TaxID=2200892 RepID=A0A2V4NA85_9RHOB|nr:ornithine cyclodeaminase [Litorivita pollutaquae]PYC47013.1 ornithine cyclodeaminase [Litorivita pollutaquae]